MVKNYRSLCAVAWLFVGLGASFCMYATGPGTPFVQEEQPKNGLLIFLDDSEDDIGAITGDFISAFVQNAGPLVVSASILANVRNFKTPTEKFTATLYNQYHNIRSKGYYAQTPEEHQEYKNIIVSQLNFDSVITKNWVIKKNNASLYLLLPNNYLQEKKVTRGQVEVYGAGSQITETELILGLKVNHMQTVAIAQITMPATKPYFADYFMQALEGGTIFVTNHEYFLSNQNKADQQKVAVPAWSLYILGHGLINDSIAHLSLDQFKKFLGFIEKKITTRLLVYSSCYSAGANADLLYKDLEKGVDKTYSFAIVAQALTDAPTASGGVTLEKTVLSALEVVGGFKYGHFLKEITRPHGIDYEQAIKAFGAPVVTFISQIKYPGLPWFSVLDSQRVVSISSVLAKTRIKRLDIAKYFAKKGVPAEPQAILLYAQDIPFMLEVNTKKNAPFWSVFVRNEYYVPIFVSMIPGEAVHHIKKIASSGNSAKAILESFFYNRKDFTPHKVFIVDEVKGLFPEGWNSRLNVTMHDNDLVKLDNVIIDINNGKHWGDKYFSYDVYFSYKGALYKNLGVQDSYYLDFLLADDAAKKKYANLLEKYGKKGAYGAAAKIKKGSKDESIYNQLTPEAIAKIKAAQVQLSPEVVAERNRIREEALAAADAIREKEANLTPAEIEARKKRIAAIHDAREQRILLKKEQAAKIKSAQDTQKKAKNNAKAQAAKNKGKQPQKGKQTKLSAQQKKKLQAQKRKKVAKSKNTKALGKGKQPQKGKQAKLSAQQKNKLQAQSKKIVEQLKKANISPQQKKRLQNQLQKIKARLK